MSLPSHGGCISRVCAGASACSNGRRCSGSWTGSIHRSANERLSRSAKASFMTDQPPIFWLLRAIGCALVALTPPSASAQAAYPSRQITIVVGFTAGGSTDVVARLVAEEMRKCWGQPVVVENRPGAGGNIGPALVAKAKPD